jgi:hypothetical protein
MTNEQAQEIYQRLFVAFPLLREWLLKADDPKATYGVWCGVMGDVDKDDAEQVVTALIAGDEQMPPAYERDRTPQMIRKAANAIRSERVANQQNYQYHLTANEAKTTDQKFIVAIRESRRLGTLVRDGKLDKEVNNVAVEELIEWSERNGEQPQWIGADRIDV